MTMMMVARMEVEIIYSVSIPFVLIHFRNSQRNILGRSYAGLGWLACNGSISLYHGNLALLLHEYCF